MCKGGLPGPNECDKLSGQMWIIGRSYSASPERTQGPIKSGFANAKPTTDSSFFPEIAELIVKDDHYDKLRTLTDEAVNRVYHLDNSEDDRKLLRDTVRFVAIFNEIIKSQSKQLNENKDIIRQAKNNISFSSKFLHFHLPQLIFIIDSFSDKAARKEVTEQIKLSKEDWGLVDAELKKDNIGDGLVYTNYAHHVWRCYSLAVRELKISKNMIPRQIDNILMGRVPLRDLSESREIA